MHTRSKGLISEEINPEIEKACKKNCKEKRERDKHIMAKDQLSKLGIVLYKNTQCQLQETI